MFKDALKNFRQKAELTQAELADKAGISRSAVAMYERGEREPDFRTLEKLAAILGVNMSALLGEEKAPAQNGEGSALSEKFNLLDDADKAYILGQIDALLSRRE